MNFHIEPLDALHRECVEARFEVRAMFMRAKLVAGQWSPKPCPPRVLPHGGDTPYLDEIGLTRPWFR